MTPAGVAGSVRYQLDRFDPLYGWQFREVLRVPVGAAGVAAVAWTPPTVGHWRIRARFLGTDSAAPSQTRATRIFVAEPLDTPPGEP